MNVNEDFKEEEITDEAETVNELREEEKSSEGTDNISKEKEKEIEELNNRLMRLQADFVNFRKRSEKEKESSIAFGIESIVCDLLPILDNFHRAVEIEQDKDSSFYKGICMIQNQLNEVLKKNSVEEIGVLGEVFDPNFHHAVIMEESSDYESGMITEVLQKGYKLKDKVIRASMVKVAK